MKKQEKKEKRPKSFRAIAVRIIALALCMWLGFAGLLTWTVSEDIFRQVDRNIYDDTNSGSKLYDNWTDFPGQMETQMLHKLSDLGIGEIGCSPLLSLALPLQPESRGRDWNWMTKLYPDNFDVAAVYFGENGDPLIASCNNMRFYYIDEESWLTKHNMSTIGCTWVNLDAIEGALEDLKPYLKDYHTIEEFMPVIRLTGWFEGNEFHPVTIDRGTGYCGWRDIPVTEVNELNALDKQGKLEWETILTVPVVPGQELITIYGYYVDSWLGHESGPVTVDGKKYESLTAWRLANDYYSDGYPDCFVARGLWDTIISYTSYGYSEFTGFFYFSKIVRFNPFQIAMVNLIPTYFVTALLIALAVGVVLWQIYWNLTEPLEKLNAVVRTKEKIVPYAVWTEPYVLQNWCKDTRQALLEAQAEVSRLNTALDYAEHAEEYRKQLISNITHELKTPLAVVHSYTEGLQSEIAPEKKERYLQVILDEAERMDGMVMQMLELSRLEAGRVKLKMEYFDLGAVIRDVAERFEPLMAEKELNLRLELDGQEQMNGDEGRIEQVITNFMSNAVKYSTPGGEILVKAVFGKLGLYFSITNNAKHLSEEGLQKVFDSFYREDAARTEKSTGLGLAIVKNIMNLHGFQCYVNNTTLNNQPAVEFGFRRE